MKLKQREIKLLVYNYHHNRAYWIKFFWYSKWGMESEDWWEWADM